MCHEFSLSLALFFSLSLSSPSRHLTLRSHPLSLFPYAHIYFISLCSLCLFSQKLPKALSFSALFLFPSHHSLHMLGLVSLKPIDQFNGETYVCVFFCHYSLMLNGGFGNRGLLEDGSVCQRWMSDAIWYRVLLTSHRQTVGYIVKPYSH